MLILDLSQIPKEFSVAHHMVLCTGPSRFLRYSDLHSHDEHEADHCEFDAVCEIDVVSVHCSFLCVLKLKPIIP